MVLHRWGALQDNLVLSTGMGWWWEFGHSRISLRWPILIINPVGKTKLSLLRSSLTLKMRLFQNPAVNTSLTWGVFCIFKKFQDFQSGTNNATIILKSYWEIQQFNIDFAKLVIFIISSYSWQNNLHSVDCFHGLGKPTTNKIVIST